MQETQLDKEERQLVSDAVVACSLTPASLATSLEVLNRCIASSASPVIMSPSSSIPCIDGPPLLKSLEIFKCSLILVGDSSFCKTNPLFSNPCHISLASSHTFLKELSSPFSNLTNSPLMRKIFLFSPIIVLCLRSLHCASKIIFTPT